MDSFTFHGNWGAPSRCGLDIVRRPDGTALVMLTELPDNKGKSVTNAFEELATIIKRTWLSDLEPDAITWIEHYPERSMSVLDSDVLGVARALGIGLYGSLNKMVPETYDSVTLAWETNAYKNPSWKHLDKAPEEISGDRRAADKLLKTFEGFPCQAFTALPMITIYEKPLDYPTSYVTRLWDGTIPRGLPFVVIAATIEELREKMPTTMRVMTRAPTDDPTIVETWL